MTVADESRRHEEVWLLLPWLANGRLAQAEREHVEQHVRRCAECEQELAVQQRMCTALTEPDRVTYAPGPSFRKLMERIDSAGAAKTPVRTKPPARARLVDHLSHVSLWRPPGLAWAASFLALFAITGLMATAYRWSQPLYKTHTETLAAAPNVLHIAFDRSLTIGEVEELLRASGARVVEGPGSTGIFGVTPADVVSGQTNSTGAKREMQVLSARLRADPRVLWVQPLADDETRVDQRAPAPLEH